jgi:hypothetical protein
VGELWAIYFDGQAGRITAAKKVVPISDCSFPPVGLDVRIGESTLGDGLLQGAAASGGHSLAWQLSYLGDQPPLLLLPEAYYERGFPKAKALVGTPNAVYNGTLHVDGQQVEIDGWTGSQNHNWGSRHTDLYAWGQVAGFDGAPEAFLELSTARVKIGPLWIPWMTLAVLRLEGEQYALNSMAQALRAHGRFDYFTWRFDTRTDQARLSGEISAPPEWFVGLRYDNPPGGHKTCLNTKLARCQLTLERPEQPPRRLLAQHRAAFEILTNDNRHGIQVVA